MPFKSEAQRRLMYAAAQGKVEGISPKTAREYIKHSGGKPPKKTRKGNQR
jgi:hypothetical protein